MCRRTITAALLALALITAACGSTTDAVVADTEEEIATVVAGETDEAETVERPEPEEEEPAADETAAEEAGDESEPIVEEEAAATEPMTVPVVNLGTSIELEFPEPVETFEGNGAIAIGRAGAFSPVESGLVIMRPTGFASEEVRGNDFTLPLLTETFDSWLTLPEVNVSAESETTVGGYDATVVDLTIEPSDGLLSDCGPPPINQCIFFASTPDANDFGITVMRIGTSVRVWYVDQGDELPLTFAAIANPGDENWLTIVDDAITSAVVGEPQPAPDSIISRVEAGWHTFDSLGGMTLDIPEQALVFEGTQCVLLQMPDDIFSSGIVIGRVNQDIDGTPIRTVDNFLAASDATVTRTETGETIDLFGTTMTRYSAEAKGEEQGIPLTCAPIGGDVSKDVTFSFIGEGGEYLANAPDGGVYIAGWATIEPDDVEQTNEMFEEMLSTIEVAGG